jgi:predicted acylesterase/phospholipase RssA
MGFFAELGLLSTLDLGHLEEISGSSAGALLAYMYVVTHGDVPKILDFAMKAPIKQVMKPNIKSLFSSYGLIPVKGIRTVCDSITDTFMQKADVTFKDLYDWNPIKFHVTSFCVDLQKTQYFSVDNTPNVRVNDAICGSIAIPFIISSCMIGELTHIDGGVEEDTPCACFLGRPKDDVLVVRFGPGAPKAVTGIKTFALNILFTLMKSRYKYTQFRSIELDQQTIDMFDFGMSAEHKLRLFLQGQAHSR